MSRRPLLVGLDNPHSSDPRAALFIRPRGSAGARLHELSGMGEMEYLRSFDRVNARDLPTGNREHWLSGRTVLVLGREAWRVLGLPPGCRFFDRVLSWDGEGKFVLVPHPSGRNHFYNSSANRRRVTRLLRRTARDG